MLLDAFAEALGCPLPGTLHQAVHRWRFARSERPLGESFLWDPDARLGVCGDWCLGGRIEGAYLSGDRLAKHVLSRAGTPRTAKLA